MNRTARLAALALLAAASGPSAAHASTADAFEDKVKPVSGQLYTKAGKLELTLPAGLLSLNDAFFSKRMVGAKLGYHFNEWFSAALTGALGGASPTGSTTVCPVSGCRPATDQQLFQVPGYIKWTAGAEVAFSPVYGKLNVFAEKAIHFDLWILAGGGLVGYRDVLSADQAVSQKLVPGTVTAPEGHVGIGARVFLARWLALRLEARDHFYSVSSLPTGKLQSQLFAEAGLSFFLPLSRQGDR